MFVGNVLAFFALFCGAFFTLAAFAMSCDGQDNQTVGKAILAGLLGLAIGFGWFAT